MSSIPSGRVDIERKGPIARVILDCSEAPGGLNRSLLIELQDVFRTLDGDAECEILILSGIDDLMCPSNDNETAVRQNQNSAEAELIAYQRAVDIIKSMRVVTIASLRGTIGDSASDLALAADLVFQSEQVDDDKPQITWATSLNSTGKAKLARLLHRFQELEPDILDMIYAPAKTAYDASEKGPLDAIARPLKVQT